VSHVDRLLVHLRSGSVKDRLIAWSSIRDRLP
jgi:hypothetical protein